MAANGDKTKVILVTTYQKEAKLPVKELTVYCDYNLLMSVDTEKHLGAKIDKHLMERNMPIKQDRKVVETLHFQEELDNIYLIKP